MSWWFNVPSTPYSDFAQAVDAAAAEFLAAPSNLGEEDTRSAIEEQVYAACNAAKVIAQSAAVGSGNLAAVFSGHANPQHEPRPGHSPETIIVQVDQTVVPPA